MNTVSEIIDFQTMQFEEVPLQNLFDKQRVYFATDVTKTYEWRVDQLDRLIRMLKDNYARFANASRDDFKTASQENVFEVSASIASTESKIPRCVGTQRNCVSRALRRHANYLPIQWTTHSLVASGGGCSFGRQSLHLKALRSAAGDWRAALGIDSKVFRAGSP